MGLSRRVVEELRPCIWSPDSGISTQSGNPRKSAYFSSTMGFTSLPIPVISISIVSPPFMNCLSE